MILVISLLIQAKNCARAIEECLHEKVEVGDDILDAIQRLQRAEFSAVIVDEILLDNEAENLEALFKHLGGAVPVSVNFAIHGTKRVLSEVKAAFNRRRREALAAKQQAEHGLREELNEDINNLLLSCEMALRVPGLPEAAECKMHSVESLARAINARLAAR